MAIPKISEQNIADALKYIDEKGAPFHNQSTKYELVTEDGKKYPPKYVIAVAAHIATGEEIDTERFNAVEAKSYQKFFRKKGKEYVKVLHRCNKLSCNLCISFRYYYSTIDKI